MSVNRKVLDDLIGKKVIVSSYLVHVGGVLGVYDPPTTDGDDPTYCVEWSDASHCLSTVFDLAEVVRVDECYFIGYEATIVLHAEDLDD